MGVVRQNVNRTGATRLFVSGALWMAVQPIAPVQRCRRSPATIQVPGLVILANGAQFVGAVLSPLAAVAKLFTVGKRGSQSWPCRT